MSFDIKKVARPRPFAVLEKPNAPKADETALRGRGPKRKLPVERLRRWAQAGERVALILAGLGAVLFFIADSGAVWLAAWMFFIALFVWLSVVGAVFLARPRPNASGGAKGGGPFYGPERTVVARQLALLAFLAASAFLLWRAAIVIRLI